MGLVQWTPAVPEPPGGCVPTNMESCSKPGLALGSQQEDKGLPLGREK